MILADYEVTLAAENVACEDRTDPIVRCNRQATIKVSQYGKPQFICDYHFAALAADSKLKDNIVVALLKRALQDDANAS